MLGGGTLNGLIGNRMEKEICIEKIRRTGRGRRIKLQKNEALSIR